MRWPGRRRGWLAAAALCVWPFWSVGAVDEPVSSAAQTPAADGAITSAEPESPPPAVLFAGSRGRFEVITVTPALGPWAIELSEAVWTHLSDVLMLPPSGFVTPVTVRLVPESLWQGDESLRVWVEAAGLVTLAVRIDDTIEARELVPALVRALLIKRGAINAVQGSRGEVPLWLELACSQWVLARLQPSLHDQWRQESLGVRPPPLLALLAWRADRPRPPTLDLVAYGALQWLHGLGRGNGQWTEFIGLQLAGQPPANCLGVFKAAGWTSLADVELDWEVAFRDLGARNPLPLLSVHESRELLWRWSRVVLHDTGQKADVLVAPTELWSARDVRAVRGLAAGRTGEIELRLGTMHPFYRNAANSLGRYFLLLRDGRPPRELEEAWTLFESDLRDAEELREDSARMLDRAQALRDNRR